MAVFKSVALFAVAASGQDVPQPSPAPQAGGDYGQPPHQGGFLRGPAPPMHGARTLRAPASMQPQGAPAAMQPQGARGPQNAQGDYVAPGGGSVQHQAGAHAGGHNAREQQPPQPVRYVQEQPVRYVQEQPVVHVEGAIGRGEFIIEQDMVVNPRRAGEVQDYSVPKNHGVYQGAPAGRDGAMHGRVARHNVGYNEREPIFYNDDIREEAADDRHGPADVYDHVSRPIQVGPGRAVYPEEHGVDAREETHDGDNMKRLERNWINSRPFQFKDSERPEGPVHTPGNPY